MNAPTNSTEPATVLVVGGSGVIGSAICQHFHSENWNVGVHYHRHQESARSVVSHFSTQEEGRSLFQADVHDSHQVQHMMKQFIDYWGKLDVLIWAVGHATDSLAVKTTSEQWQDTIQSNLTGLFFCLQSIGPTLQAQQSGSVLILSSLASRQGTTGQAAYAAAKAGTIGLMQSVAREWGAFNIRVNAVFPGWHHSPLSHRAFPSPDTCQDHVLGRTPQIEETAHQIFHLATSKDISGQVFNLDSRI